MNLPREAWHLPLLRGLDARGKADLELGTILRHYAAGDVVYVNGHVADVLYVVIAGEVRVADADGRERVLPAVSSFGEEAILGPQIRRAGTARAVTRSDICALPMHVIERALVRQGGGEWFEREVRTVRRRICLDRIRQNGHGGVGTEAWLDGAVDLIRPAGSLVRLPRGARAFLVEGILEVHVLGGEERAGFQSGDYLDAAEEDRVFLVTRSAWLVCDRIAPDSLVSQTSAARVGVDLERWTQATSLLLVDQDRCISCGECESACRDSHTDAISRLALAGEASSATAHGVQSTWLVGQSCHHCESPMCLVDCPTGAIRRDASGVVVINADQCTACGSCERACRWGNIRMHWLPGAPGVEEHRVAVKCDLCSAHPGGRPACVDACPTGALVRVAPKVAIAELGGATGESRRAPWSHAWAALAAMTLGAVVLLPVGRGASGMLAAFANLALVAYSGRRRFRNLRAIPSRAGEWLLRAHVVVSALSLVSVLKHGAPLSGAPLPLVLWIAYWVAASTGVALVALYAFRAPRASASGDTNDSGLADRFRALSGQSNAIKNVYLTMLAPFERSFWSTWRVALRSEAVRRELIRRLHGLKTLGHGEREALESILAVAIKEKERTVRETVLKLRRALILLHAVASVLMTILMLLHGGLAVLGK